MSAADLEAGRIQGPSAADWEASLARRERSARVFMCADRVLRDDDDLCLEHHKVLDLATEIARTFARNDPEGSVGEPRNTDHASLERQRTDAERDGRSERDHLLDELKNTRAQRDQALREVERLRIATPSIPTTKTRQRGARPE